MTKTLKYLLAALLLTTPAYAQIPVTGRQTNQIQALLVSQLPTGRKIGTVYVVTDGASSSDCSTGSGSDVHTCLWNGSAWAAIGGASGTGTVTSATIAGTANQITASGTCTITTTGTCTLSLVAAQILGTDNSVAGTLQLANSAANAHNIISAGATTTNTVKFFATAPTTGDLVSCTTSSTTCTLTDSGVLAANVVLNTVTVNGHALSSNVTVSASDLTTGSLPNARLPVDNFYTSITTASNTTQNQNVFTQNHIYALPFYLRAGNYSFGTIFASFQAIDNSSNSYDLGIYGGTGSNSCEAGHTAPLVAHTASFAGSALPTPGSAGTKGIAATGGTFTTVGGGWYAIAITSSAATPLIRLGGTSGSFLLQPWTSFTTEASDVGTSSSATLPGSITCPATVSGGGALAVQGYVGLMP